MRPFAGKWPPNAATPGPFAGKRPEAEPTAGGRMRLPGMSPMHSEYWLDVFRLEHAERVRAARMGRLAVSMRTPSPVRRRFGSALIRLGLLIGGPTVARPAWMLSPHSGGAAR